MSAKPLYKISFLSNTRVYELYARHVAGSSLWGFTEIGEFVFDVREGMVVDPAEERLRDEFGNTRMLHIPMQHVLRIEEVEKRASQPSAMQPPARPWSRRSRCRPSRADCARPARAAQFTVSSSMTRCARVRPAPA